MNPKKIIVYGIGAAALCACAYIRPFRFLENIFYDLTLSRAATTRQDAVVIVGIDPQSIEKLGAWPWPRATIARCIEKITAAGPSALAIDILFPKRGEDSSGSVALAKALCSAGNVVLPFRARAFGSGEQGSAAASIPAFVSRQRVLMVSHPEKLAGLRFFKADCFDASDSLFSSCAARGGVINVTTSSSTQKLRQVVQVIQSAEDYYPSFSLSAAAAYLNCKQDEIVLDGTGYLCVKDRRVPLSSYAATTPLHFRGGSGAITTISASRLCADSTIAASLRDKLVFFGLTDAAAGVDFFTTPVGSQFPGVEMWATAALDIVQKSWIREEIPVYDACNLALALIIFPGLLIIPGLKKGHLLAAVSILAAASIGAGPFLMRSSLYFWSPLCHILAWVACITTVAARKNVAFLSDDVPMDFSAPDTAVAQAPAPPKQDDFLQTLPQTPSALFVARKLNIIKDMVAQAAPSGDTFSRTISNGNTPGAPVSFPAPSAQTPFTPEELERFGALCGGKILRLLGSGGMADVYLVWIPRLEVYRAVKVLKPGRPEPFLARFETEIRILSKLMHPQIVQFFGVGEWQGLPYIEMEYVQGAAMDDVCERHGLLSPHEAMAVGILTCRALHYAHTQPTTIYGAAYKGVIHRDLKPANIMINRHGDIKLTDFGIARPEAVSLHTIEAGKVVGTLPYLAPEQLDGAEITARIDIYALGATLYELVCGERAFPQTEMSSLIKAKAIGNVKPMPGRVPKQLAAIIGQAMAIKPGERYGSALTMGRDLEKALRNLAGAQGYAILQDLAKRIR